MNLRFFLFVFCQLLLQNVFSQIKPGTKRYFFSRNRLIEFSFEETRIVNRQLDWDLQPYEIPEEPDTMLIVNQLTAGNNTFYIWKKSGASPTEFLVFEIGNPSKEQEAVFSIVGVDTQFVSAEQAKKSIKPDQPRCVGPTLYNQATVNGFKSKPSILQMTAADFRRFVALVDQGRRELDSLEKSHVPLNGILYFGYAKLRQYIIDIGYNPLFSSHLFDELLNKFKDNPETRDAYNKMFN